MKNKWLAIVGIGALTALTSVQAVPVSVAGFSGTAVVASSFLGPFGKNLTVTYNVFFDSSASLVTGQYEYTYVVNNPAGNGDSFNNPEMVHDYNVSFNAAPAGALISGNYTSSTLGGVTWTSTGLVAPGFSSITLFFWSDLAPSWGNDNAADGVPPSPWSSLNAGGQPVPVPTVPDGGATVMLLGAALTGLGLLRRKLIA